MGLALRGWALAHQERTAEGIAEIKAGMAILAEMGTQLGSTFGAMLLAEAYQQAGLVDEGLAVVSEALTDVEKREEASYAAELYRLQGELLLATSAAQPDAETAFTKALNIARQQQAKLFELRAVMGLSRMWQQQGKFIEAHSLLAVTYNQFTEGLSTPDLQSAAELLAELSS
jgi:predicted ATPase